MLKTAMGNLFWKALFSLIQVISYNLYAQLPQYNFNDPYGSTNVFRNNEQLKRTNFYSNPTLESQNRQAMQMMGIKDKLPPTKEEILRKHNEDFQKLSQRHIDEVYRDIKEADNAIQKAPRKNPLLADKNFKLVDTASLAFKADVNLFYSAYNTYLQMLEGKKSLDLSEAVFMNENAYLSGKLNYGRFNSDIQKCLDICNLIIKKEGLDFNSKDARNFAIQKLFNDTMKIYNPLSKKTETHYPFMYDFSDPLGEKDLRNYFVVKLLYNRSGQCHSMPLLYLILAQKMKVEAYLSKSPSHSYIQYKDAKGIYHNFETTNGYLVTRDWYVSSNHVSANSIKNRVYLSPMSLKETIAECLVELGYYYKERFGNDGFPVQCALTALKYYSHCSSAAIAIYNSEVIRCAYLAFESGFPPLDQIGNYPELKKAFDNMVGLQMTIDDSGYDNMARDEYVAWLQSVEAEKYKKKHEQLNQTIRENLKKN